MKQVAGVLLLLCLWSSVFVAVADDALPVDISLVRARIDFKKTNMTEVTLWKRSTNCYKCLFIPLLNVSTTYSDYAQISSQYMVEFQVQDKNGQILADFDFWPGEHGKYSLDVTEDRNGVFANNWTTDIEPENSMIPIYIAIGVYTGLAIIWIVISKLYKAYSNKSSRRSEAADGNSIQGKTGSQKPDQIIVRSKARVKALDTFRGISLCVMIFVNYGGGSYWFFDHSTWNGLTWADLVFPWFIFMMGAAIPIAFKSLIEKGATKKELFLKTVRRSVILFGLGMFLNGGADLPHWRIPGVLQRFGIAYFVVACIFIFVPTTKVEVDAEDEENQSLLTSKDKPRKKFSRMTVDLWPFYLQWIIVLSFLIIWFAITFALPVPGCPTGYIGPGGIGDGGIAQNCTGGAAGYIDSLIFTQNHIYQWPTCADTYQTGAYDPEGLLGNLTSIFLCWLGLQAGRIIVTYRSDPGRILRWSFWGIFWAGLGTILCYGQKNGGPLPLNKNLWSASFVFVMGGTGYLVLTLCYFLIDVLDIWNGAPFIYLGMNSILMYVGHEMCSQYFPFNFDGPDTHMHNLATNLVGVSMWLLIAYYCFEIKFFIAI